MKVYEATAAITLDTKEYERDLHSAGNALRKESKESTEAAQREYDKLSAWMVAKGQVIGNALTGMARKLGNLAGDMLKTGYTYNKQLEMYTTNLEVMLGSAEKAAQKVNEMKIVANATPFDMTDLVAATQTMLSFRVEESKTTDILKMLGDVALGNKERLQGLANIFSKVSASSKLTGDAIRVFISNGFNPLTYITQRTGESMEAVNKRMAAGKVTVAELEQALKDATSEGGMFYKGMEKGSLTLEGQISTLRGTWENMLGILAQPFNRIMKSDVVAGAQSAIDSISGALERLFGSSNDANEALQKLFGTNEEVENGEKQAESAQSWYDRFMTVWTDGKKEDDETVKSFVDSFAANTTTLVSQLEDRKAKLAEEGKDTTEIDAALTTLKGIDEEVASILEAAQGKQLTPEQITRLQEIVGLKTDLETLVTGGAAAGTAEEAMGKIGTAIANAGDAIADFIDNIPKMQKQWETFKDKVSKSWPAIVTAFGLIAAAISPTRTLLGAIGIATLWVIKNWDKLSEQAKVAFQPVIDFLDQIRNDLIQIAGWFGIDLGPVLGENPKDKEDPLARYMPEGSGEEVGFGGGRAGGGGATSGTGGGRRSSNTPASESNGDNAFEGPGYGGGRVKPTPVEIVGERTSGELLGEEPERTGELRGPTAEDTNTRLDVISAAGGTALAATKEQAGQVAKLSDSIEAMDTTFDAWAKAFEEYNDPNLTDEEKAEKGAAVQDAQAAYSAALTDTMALMEDLNEGVSDADSEMLKLDKQAKTTKDQLDKVGDAATDAARELKKVKAPTPDGGHIAENAAGGIFTKATFFPNADGGNVVGEAGAEAVLPLKMLWQEMGARMYDAVAQAFPVQAFAEAIAGQPIALKVGNKELAYAQRDANAQQQAARTRQVAFGYGRG